jgi:hypothetical protein
MAVCYEGWGVIVGSSLSRRRSGEERREPWVLSVAIKTTVLDHCVR